MSEATSEKNDPVLKGHGIWIEVATTGDVAKLESILSDDVLLMPPNETSLYGKTEAQEWFREYFESFHIETLTPTDREVIVTDGIAIEHWTYMVAIDPVDGADRIRDDGRFLTIWKRQLDGSWRISHSIWNSVRAIGSGTSRFLAKMKRKY